MSWRQPDMDPGPKPAKLVSTPAIVAIILLMALFMVICVAAVIVVRFGANLDAFLSAGMPAISTAAIIEFGQPDRQVQPGLQDPGAVDPGSEQPTTLSTPNPLRAKPITGRPEQPRPRWTATPVPTNTPTPSPTPNPTFVSSAYGLGEHMPPNIGPGERWIDVNVSEQKLKAFEGLIPVFETLVSTGTANHPTVTGQFRIWLRFRSQDMNGYRLGYDYYLKGVPYVQYFYEDYALHGTYWHSNFGTPMSHGCVNLSPADSEWLFNWAGYGTLVNVHP